MDYTLWGRKESDTTERLTLSLSPALTTRPPGKSCVNFKKGLSHV